MGQLVLSLNEVLRSPRGLRAVVGVGAALGLSLLAAVVAPAAVRAKVRAEAEARGLSATVSGVSFGRRGLWLEGLEVSIPGQSAELVLAAVNVEIFSGRVRGSGGTLRGAGDVGELWRRWRGPNDDAAPASGVGSGRELSVDGLFVEWRRGDETVELWGARARRAHGELQLGADLVRWTGGSGALQARGMAVGLSTSSGRRQLVSLESRAVDWVWSAVGVGAGAGDGAASSPAVVTERPARLRQLRALLAPLLSEWLAEDAVLGLEGVSVRVENGAEALSFGPSRLSLNRQGDSLRIALTPTLAEAGATPLALNVTVPLARGSVHVVAKGGPVSFASLGVRAAKMGLLDERRATVEVDGTADFAEDFETVSLDGKVTVGGLLVQRGELSREPVGPWGFEAALSARAHLDGSEVSVLSSEARVGELRAELAGRFENAPGRRHIEGRLRVPLAACQSMLEATPHGLLPLVSDLRLSGAFGIDLQVRYDALLPKDARVVLAVRNECQVQSVPPGLSARRFERPFTREVKAADGSAMVVESGPGTRGWVPLDEMSRHLETAVLICEDSRFHAHAGFDFTALENALKDDLRQGRFARGASTVSMQLAKNLYLGMEKTLGRKLQEALLTMVLEQQLDKRRILELYWNVVELGPGLYGVGEAAQHYFASSPSDLSLGQALYLASILPNPTQSRFAADGRLKPHWRSYLNRLMHIAHKIKRIDDAELAAALSEEVAFRVPADVASRSLPLGAPGESFDEPPPADLDALQAP
jgi:Transglycosylase